MEECLCTARYRRPTHRGPLIKLKFQNEISSRSCDPVIIVYPNEKINSCKHKCSIFTWCMLSSKEPLEHHLTSNHCIYHLIKTPLNNEPPKRCVCLTWFISNGDKKIKSCNPVGRPWSMSRHRRMISLGDKFKRGHYESWHLGGWYQVYSVI